nr:tyrosine-protein phosphatase [Longispora sp. (in: high G+C Gram-positive bacteria)]
MTLLNGAENARDFGGCATKNGRKVVENRLFRSDSLSRLTAQDLTTMVTWGLSQVVDLRGHPEVAMLGQDQLPDGVQARHIPIFDEHLEVYGVLAAAIGSGDPERQSALLGDGGGTRLMVDMYRWFVTNPTA